MLQNTRLPSWSLFAGSVVVHAENVQESTRWNYNAHFVRWLMQGLRISGLPRLPVLVLGDPARPWGPLASAPFFLASSERLRTQPLGFFHFQKPRVPGRKVPDSPCLTSLHFQILSLPICISISDKVRRAFLSNGLLATDDGCGTVFLQPR